MLGELLIGVGVLLVLIALWVGVQIAAGGQPEGACGAGCEPDDRCANCPGKSVPQNRYQTPNWGRSHFSLRRVTSSPSWPKNDSDPNLVSRTDF